MENPKTKDLNTLNPNQNPFIKTFYGLSVWAQSPTSSKDHLELGLGPGERERRGREEGGGESV